MKTSLRLARPSSFWVTAMLSTLVLLGIVYPWLEGHPDLLAIPIVGGTILTFCSQVSAIGIRTLVKRPSISSELIAFEHERQLAWLADAKYRAFLVGLFRILLHHFRSRYRALLREEVAKTVESEANVDDEIRYLCATLSAEPR